MGVPAGSPTIERPNGPRDRLLTTRRREALLLAPTALGGARWSRGPPGISQATRCTLRGIRRYEDKPLELSAAAAGASASAGALPTMAKRGLPRCSSLRRSARGSNRVLRDHGQVETSRTRRSIGKAGRTAGSAFGRTWRRRRTRWTTRWAARGQTRCRHPTSPGAGRRRAQDANQQRTDTRSSSGKSKHRGRRWPVLKKVRSGTTTCPRSAR